MTDLIILLLTIISLISFFWMVFTTPVLLRNRFELTRLPGLQADRSNITPSGNADTIRRSSGAQYTEPLRPNISNTTTSIPNISNPNISNPNTSIPNISICIPVRNEEAVIDSLLNSLRQQTWPRLEILVLDDHSDDKTPQLLKAQKTLFSNAGIPFQTLQGRPKPHNWLGKPWACHQLAQKATGDILLFLDADTLAEPSFTERITQAMEDQDLDMITVWPHQILGSFWEKTVIPLMYYALVTLLPSIYAHRPPRWMPPPFRNTFRTAFAAACGQCIGFRKEAYHTTGGHEAVKNQIVEDVELAKLVRFHHLRFRMFEGVTSLQCRMYRGEKEMFQGFRKNFLAGFGNHLPLFIASALIHITVFLMPFLILPYALTTQHAVLMLLSAGSIGLLLAHRLLLDSWFQWNPVYGFLHPLGVLWYQRLGFIKILDHLLKRKTEWKGREV